ncbi:hypothetical protein [Haloarcula halophila]|uniref:hypothetical protein n=1 Tax=Haloarcula TaxID=2237 RepID=UPI0023E3F7E3|nr:hypothetical protein [Halomicroarcula sp. DFY41]
MSYYNSSFLSDYANIRTIPATLSVAFIMASLYQFGGVSTIDLVWFGYTLSTSHSLLVSLGAFAVAFASSETKSFEYYRSWEQVAIFAGPAVILMYEFFPGFGNLLAQLGDPLGMQIAFLATIISWSVAVQ